MQAPGGPEEDPAGGFEHGGWAVGYWDDDLSAAMGESMAPPFDLVLGRKTYEIFAAHWPHTDAPGAGELNSATKHVASTTLTELEWQNSKLIEGDVADAVRKLKQQDGPELQVHGSANLIQTLLEHGLVDEFRLKIFPLVLGTGKRLFGDGTVPAGFEVASCGDAERGGAGAPGRARALSERAHRRSRPLRTIPRAAPRRRCRGGRDGRPDRPPPRRLDELSISA